ncbi:MAG TPA: hypothetical protein VK395_36605 [Gemmataceae bacterium]|nr:hypothetical protein [Gemmataceae bacterium]
MKPSLLIAFLTVACHGCTTFSLNQHTLAQIQSNETVRRQEVLDNLAMIADDPYALPAYSSIFAGTITVSDTVGLGSVITWGIAMTALKDGFSSVTGSPSIIHQANQNWTLDPIVVPEKLEAIRAACKGALGYSLTAHEVSLLDRPDHYEFKPGLNATRRENDKVEGYVLETEPQERHFGGVDMDIPNGIGVHERLRDMGTGWVHYGPLSKVPLQARYKAHCGDTWIWILPCDADKLSSFTIVIQDIARVDSNSTTLYCALPTRSPFSFWTKSWSVRDPLDQSKTVEFQILATVVVDPWMRIATDTPYRIGRVDNVGSQASLRSQIAASAPSP